MQIGRDAGDQDGGKQAERERTRTAPGNQHDDGYSQKQDGEFHSSDPMAIDAPVYDKFAGQLREKQLRSLLR